jgi:hypothetical protein
MEIFQGRSTPQWAKSIKSRKGRQNGFHLEPKCAGEGSRPARRAFDLRSSSARPDMFAILAPQVRW